MKKSIITVLIIVLVGMIAFSYFNNTPDVSQSLLVTDVKSTDSDQAKYIYSMLQKLSQVTLNNSIFLEPAFQNLKDNNVDFPSQPAGRENPFAPVGSDSNATER